MDDNDGPAAMHEYYELDKERDRLAAGSGQVEYLRTVEIVGRTLPPAPAAVADIGGGPGRFTDWLVGEGYSVIHRDPVAHHVSQVQARHGDRVDAAVGDARALDLPDASVDMVLLLGPLYHLPSAADRALALEEAVRVVRPGGYVHAAAISRWAARLHGVLVERLHNPYPAILDMVAEMERSGRLDPIVEGGFTGFAHRPDELRHEVEASGLELVSVVALEGISFALHDLDDRLADPEERSHLLDNLRAVETVPELAGLGPHLLATARRPAAGS